MLRLVKPEPPKQPPKRRKYARTPILSADEEQRFRQALRNMRDHFGTYACLAAAMNLERERVYNAATGKAGYHVTGDVIVAAMRASGLTLAELLGGPAPAERCRACGQIKRRAA